MAHSATERGEAVGDFGRRDVGIGGMPTAPAETAIAAFERATGLTVVLHAPEDHRAALLPATRFLHLQPVCVAAKALHRARCTSFDGERLGQALRAAAVSGPGGPVLVKCCHAGVVEWCTAITPGSPWRLFAGQRRAGADLVPDFSQRAAVASWREEVQRLAPVDAAESAWISELLAQLAARLAQLLPAPVAMQATAPGPRAELIRRLVHEFHVRSFTLDELARHLGVSPARAGHAVREACGTSFLALLTAQRLATAEQLLRETALPVEAVARAAGFADASRFHRCFRERHGQTPAAFRQGSRQSGRPVPPA
jgi:AraC-like DNA-binding protein